MAELPDGLLAAVRNYLDITWTDADGDEKLTGIISRGMAYIDKAAGTACNYENEDKPRELLFDYCRYVRSGALDEFSTNYLSELLDLQHSVMVADGMDKASLSALSIGNLTLSPAFSAAVCEYAATAVNDSDTVTATAKNPFAEVAASLNGVPFENGGPVRWQSGSNIVTAIVTYGAVSLCYRVKVTR